MGEKDYSLLRPFDLEAVKRGEAIIWTPNIDCVFLGESINRPNIPAHGPQYRIEHRGGMSYASACDLRMAPLCWVEGKPVYKGDRPWNKIDGKQYTVTRFCKSTEVLQTVEERSDGVRSICIEDATWTPPKVKREGWVVVLPEMVLTEAQAKHIASATGTSIAARIEWEEPATQEVGAA